MHNKNLTISVNKYTCIVHVYKQIKKNNANAAQFKGMSL